MEDRHRTIARHHLQQTMFHVADAGFHVAVMAVILEEAMQEVGAEEICSQVKESIPSLSVVWKD
jgi:hypothetical protein